MTILAPVVAVSPLRQRLIDEMDIRRFGHETQRNYIRDVGRFATFLGRSPDTATAEDVRRFQIEQGELDVPAPTMNAIVSALRFFFTQTLDRPDLARKLVRMRHERKTPSIRRPDTRDTDRASVGIIRVFLRGLEVIIHVSQTHLSVFEERLRRAGRCWIGVERGLSLSVRGHNGEVRAVHAV